MSQGDLVERVRRFAPAGRRFARETLSRIENGRTQPDTWIVDALAQALDTSTDYLLGLTDDPNMPGVGGYPVPEPDIAELVGQLNDLPVSVRRLVARAVEEILRIYHVRSVELETELFRTVVAAMPEEQQAAFLDRFDDAARRLNIDLPTPSSTTQDADQQATG